MVNVWILTVVLSWASGTAAVQTYEFKNRDECVKAQTWYKNSLGYLIDKTLCYPSLPTKK